MNTLLNAMSAAWLALWIVIGFISYCDLRDAIEDVRTTRSMKGKRYRIHASRVQDLSISVLIISLLSIIVGVLAVLTPFIMNLASSAGFQIGARTAFRLASALAFVISAFAVLHFKYAALRKRYILVHEPGDGFGRWLYLIASGKDGRMGEGDADEQSPPESGIGALKVDITTTTTTIEELHVGNPPQSKT